MKILELDTSEEYQIKFKQTPTGEAFPWVDVIDQMPVNHNPDDPYFVSRGIKTWWERSPSQIDGIAIHHAISHNMQAIADYITRPRAQGGKGRPTTEYTFWITTSGEVRLCNDLKWGCWHDHCGHQNTHISIGFAGRWDYEKPPTVQLEACANLCRWLMNEYDIPLVNVKGHQEWARDCAGVSTACPGWNVAKWKTDFYALFGVLPSFSVEQPPMLPLLESQIELSLE